MEKYWGYHLILNAGTCNKDAICSASIIEYFVKKLVKDIDMVAYGEPQIVKFGSGDKEGYTLVQLIETSNICCHFVDSTGAAYLDVFSCKPFDSAVVIRLFRQIFAAENMNYVFIRRDEQESQVVDTGTYEYSIDSIE